MIKKYCPNCRKTSYSACAEGTWVCPSCGQDLTHEPVLPLSAVQDREDICIAKPGRLGQKLKHLKLVYSK